MCKGVTASGGSVYVTGEFRGNVDFDPGSGEAKLESVPGASFVSKFDVGGGFKWVRGWAGDGGLDDIGVAVAVDGMGGVYVTGVFDGEVDLNPSGGVDLWTSYNSYPDVYLVKLLEDGSYVWGVAWGGEIDDAPGGVRCDSWGNVYVVGGFGGTVDFDPGSGVDVHVAVGQRDAFLTSFSSGGGYLWSRTWGGDVSGVGWQYTDGASRVYVKDERIYVGGFFNGVVDFDPGAGVHEITGWGWQDAFLSVYDLSGEFQWARGWGGENNDVAYGVTVDAMDNCFVSGVFQSKVDFDPGIWEEEHQSKGGFDAFLMKFLPGGEW